MAKKPYLCHKLVIMAIENNTAAVFPYITELDANHAVPPYVRAAWLYEARRVQIYTSEARPSRAVMWSVVGEEEGRRQLHPNHRDYWNRAHQTSFFDDLFKSDIMTRYPDMTWEAFQFYCANYPYTAGSEYIGQWLGIIKAAVFQDGEHEYGHRDARVAEYLTRLIVDGMPFKTWYENALSSHIVNDPNGFVAVVVEYGKPTFKFFPCWSLTHIIAERGFYRFEYDGMAYEFDGEHTQIYEIGTEGVSNAVYYKHLCGAAPVLQIQGEYMQFSPESRLHNECNDACYSLNPNLTRYSTGASRWAYNYYFKSIIGHNIGAINNYIREKLAYDYMSGEHAHPKEIYNFPKCESCGGSGVLAEKQCGSCHGKGLDVKLTVGRAIYIDPILMAGKQSVYEIIAPPTEAIMAAAARAKDADQEVLRAFNIFSIEGKNSGYAKEMDLLSQNKSITNFADIHANIMMHLLRWLGCHALGAMVGGEVVKKTPPSRYNLSDPEMLLAQYKAAQGAMPTQVLQYINEQFVRAITSNDPYQCRVNAILDKVSPLRHLTSRDLVVAMENATAYDKTAYYQADAILNDYVGDLEGDDFMTMDIAVISDAVHELIEAKSTEIGQGVDTYEDETAAQTLEDGASPEDNSAGEGEDDATL